MMARPKARLVVPSFFPEARKLRGEFEDLYSDPGRVDPRRFRWDLFHVEGQYSHLRTPAYLFFSESLYRRFHERLVDWGRRTLGCHDVSPTWLSLYLDGNEQRLHADVPHGPWAFVYSLTLPSPRRKGGETLFLSEETLDFWRSFASGDRFEESRIVESVEPRFGQLLAFDGRIPHGVRQVEGTRDPLHGRLVIHGWFVEPRPFIEGPHRRDQVSRAVEAFSEGIEAWMPPSARLHGTMSVRLNIAKDGKISKIQKLASTLRDLEGASADGIERKALRALAEINYGKAKGASILTLPLLFR